MSMIHVKDLRFTYPGTDKAAVKGISFDISEGEILGFLGPSGAGKSTTQKVLIGLLKGYEGQVSIMGRELTGWGRDYYEGIGVSFELPNHFLKLTALENLNYFRSLYSGETADPKDLLEMVGLGDSGDMPVAQFSKGMKNRLNVARSLLNKPKLLFLDEPTAGLDPVNARLIKDLILKVRSEGTTVFVTTHNMMVADEICDRVAFILSGSIILIDTPKALKLQYGKREVSVEYHNGTGDTHEKLFPLDGLGQDNDFIGVLNQYNVQTIHTQETTLEKIFIEVTGSELV